jgi:CheY-like chemotaxis protein
MGHRVRIAYNAASAIEELAANIPEVVFSDIAMPHMDGCELARYVRRDAKLQDVVLIALTGYGQETDVREALDAGFEHYLVKPVDVEALCDLLASLPQRPAHESTDDVSRISGD